MQKHIKIDDIIELEIKRMGINGEGIGYYEKLAVFVPFALPGEKVKARVTNVFDNRAEAELDRILIESSNRIEPFCPVYEKCGGCQTQHYSYNRMLEEKRDIILKSFDRYLAERVNRKVVKSTIGMDEPTKYRNKASLPVKYVNNKNVTGMYVKNTTEFVRVVDCPIQSDLVNEVLKETTNLMDKYKINAYDEKKKKGVVKSLVVRATTNLKEVQVSFIMIQNVDLTELAKELMDKILEVKSVFKVINKNAKKQTFFSEKIELVKGVKTINEKINDQIFSLEPAAFFQLNTVQADKFYNIMKKMSNLNNTEIAVDAYAGIAPVSHYIHDVAKKVYAIEIEESAVISARKSLLENDITNVEVVKNDFGEAIKKIDNVDVMFFDPPRGGLGEDVIKTVLRKSPSRIIYGSCNPSTLAKDISLLSKRYKLVEVVPVDMFPFTSLVESVSLLELIGER